MSEPDPGSWLDEHGDVLYRFALARVRDPATAEDLVQDTLLAAWQSRDRYEGRASERTWLAGILKHKIMDHFRRLYRREAPLSLDDEDSAALTKDFDRHDHWDVHGGRAPKSWGDALAAFDRAEFWRAFEDCMEHLPTGTARAFALRELDGWTTEDICKALQISTTNLWVMLHRARTRLRRCLETTWFAP